MALIRPGTLLFAALISGPALWHAFVQHDLDASSALERFLIAILRSFEPHLPKRELEAEKE